MRSLRVAIPLALITLQALAIVAIVMLTYLASEQVLLTAGSQSTERLVRDATRFTEGFLQPADVATNLTRRLAESDVVDAGEAPRLARYFYETLRAQPAFAGIFLGEKDGDFLYVSRDREVAGASYRIKRIETAPARRVELDYRDAAFAPREVRLDPADAYDPRARPWYGAAASNGRVSWTDPYIFFSSRKPGITVAAPVLRDGALLGVVGIDIEIDALSGFLDALEIGRDGSAAIVTDDGHVVAHPNASIVRETDTGVNFATFGEIEDDALRQALRAMPGGLGGDDGGVIRPVRFEVDGMRWLGAVQRLESTRTPWTVVAYLPEDDLVAPLKRMRTIAAVIALVVLLLTALLAAVLVRRITRPLDALAVEAGRLSMGDFGERPRVRARFTEIDRTGTALHRAANWLRGYVARNDELTRGLEEAGRTLERRVQERTEELSVANAELDRRNRSLEDFAHIASHDLRQPLRAIRHFTEFLREDHGARIPDEGRRMIDTITQSAGRLDAMITGLLEYARASRADLRREDVDLARVVEDVRAELDGAIAEVDGRVEVSPLPSASADPVLARQLLRNLIGNALKYRAPGRRPLIEIGAEPLPEGGARVYVRDNGTGFEAGQVDHLFRSFKRLDAASGLPGTGIGLALCRTICERHGWRISATGEPDRGATFRIDMPDAGAASPDPRWSPDPRRSQDPR